MQIMKSKTKREERENKGKSRKPRKRRCLIKMVDREGEKIKVKVDKSFFETFQ